MIENVVQNNWYEFFGDSIYTWMQNCCFYLNVRLHFLNLVETRWSSYHPPDWVKY
jgi:hypothetical protein